MADTLHRSSGCTSLLRIGGPHSDATQRLQTAIWEHFQRKKMTTTGEPIIMTKKTTNMELQLENKYFIANVQLVNFLKDYESLFNDQDDSNHDNHHQQQQQQQRRRHHYAAEDGIILVFDAIQYNPDYPNGSSFHDLETIQSVIKTTTTTTTTDYLLQLCVGISVHSSSSFTPEQKWRGKNHEDEYSRRILWCLDHGYEYIEADLSYDGQRTGHEDRDKDGFARIIEAIEGTVWSSAIQKKNATTTTSETSIDRQTSTHTVTMTKFSQQSSSLTCSNPFLSSQRPDSDMNDVDVDIDVDDNNNEDAYLQEPETPEEASQRERHSQEAKAYTELESLMKEANRIRFMSQRGELSDDDRRTRAAQAATLMMNLMDQMGLHKDDDDDESQCSDSSRSNS
jgi:hypothetical protein